MFVINKLIKKIINKLTILLCMKDNDHYAKIHYVPLHHKESTIFGFDPGLTCPNRINNKIKY